MALRYRSIGLLVALTAIGCEPMAVDSQDGDAIEGIALYRLHAEDEHIEQDDGGEPNFDEGDPIEGLVVRELGTSHKAVSGADGRFSLVPGGDDVVELISVLPDYLSRVITVSWSGYELDDRRLEIDIPEAEHEHELYAELFDIDYDPDLGHLYVHPYAPGGESLAGMRISIDAPYSQHRVYELVQFGDEEAIIAVDAQILIEHSPDPQVMFAAVEPGPVSITVEPPDGIECHGAHRLDLVPDAFTDALFVCVAE